MLWKNRTIVTAARSSPNCLCVLVVSIQGSSEAGYVATMKTVRQVKTVFIIFIAFVSCWIPYVVVLLYDSSDSLPLPVHLYTSMLADRSIY